MTGEKPVVAIAGAGVIGACLALFLARAGCTVKLFDAGQNSKSATPRSFGWINAHSPENAHHFRLRLQSMTLWKSLLQDYPDLPLSFGGGIDWDLPQESISAASEHYISLGSNTRLINRKALAGIFPHHPGLPDFALHNMDEGIAVPALISKGLVSAAQEAGAQFHSGQIIERLQADSGQITAAISNDGKTAFDHIVFCAGIETNTLLEQIGCHLPMDNRPGRLMRTAPLPKLTPLVTSSPGLHFWQAEDGCILAGSTQAGTFSTGEAEWETEIAKKLLAFFPRGTQIRDYKTVTGVRPMPADGMPVIGPVPGLRNASLAVMHSGITLAAIVAKLLSNEIIEEKTQPALDPYRFSRFTGASISSMGVAP